MAKLYTFRVTGGEHIGNKRNYKDGYTFQSRYALDEIFVGKFVRIPDEPVVVDDEDGPPKHLIPPKGDVTSPYGEIRAPKREFNFDEAADVTRLFPKAKEAELSVYKDELGVYAVSEADAKVKVNLAESIMSSKKQVNEFIAAFTVSSPAED